MTFQKMKFFPWDFQNFSLGNGKSKIPFSLGIPMMGIPRAETLIRSRKRDSLFKLFLVLHNG
jgi:hypothetical protein